MKTSSKTRSSQEILIKQLMIEGIKSIQSGDNPRIVEQKLIAYIEPKKRQEASIEVLTAYAESKKSPRG